MRLMQQQTKQRRLSGWAHGFALLAAVTAGLSFVRPLGWDYAIAVGVTVVIAWFVGAAVWESTRS